MAKFRMLILLLFSHNYLANLQIRKLASLIIGSDSHHLFFLNVKNFTKLKLAHSPMCILFYKRSPFSEERTFSDQLQNALIKQGSP